MGSMGSGRLRDGGKVSPRRLGERAVGPSKPLAQARVQRRAAPGPVARPAGGTSPVAALVAPVRAARAARGKRTRESDTVCVMSHDPAALVWLFDVDGTLLLTQGAGRDALVCALREVYEIEDDLGTIPFAGRTDVLIVNDIAKRHGIRFAAGERATHGQPAQCAAYRTLLLGSAWHVARRMRP